MSVSLKLPQANEFHTPGRYGDDGEHGENGHNSEGQRYHDHSADILLCSRVHDQRDERLTGSEYEYGEQDPGCYIGLFPLVMDMNVAMLMGVCMLVLITILMEVDMSMRFFSDGPV